MKTNCTPALLFSSAQLYMYVKVIFLDSHYYIETGGGLITFLFVLFFVKHTKKKRLQDVKRLAQAA